GIGWTAEQHTDHAIGTAGPAGGTPVTVDGQCVGGGRVTGAGAVRVGEARHLVLLRRLPRLIRSHVVDARGACRHFRRALRRRHVAFGALCVADMLRRGAQAPRVRASASEATARAPFLLTVRATSRSDDTTTTGRPTGSASTSCLIRSSAITPG